MDRMSARSRGRGFTLFELLVVLLIVAPSLTVVTPSFMKIIHRAKMTAESSRLLLALNLARSEAVLRNVTVTVCPSSMAATGEAACSGRFAQGWIIFVNASRDRELDTSDDEVLHVFTGLPAGFSLRNRAGDRPASGLINFFPDGTSHSNQTLLFCPPAGIAVSSRSVVINIIGRARLSQQEGTCQNA